MFWKKNKKESKDNKPKITPIAEKLYNLPKTNSFQRENVNGFLVLIGGAEDRTDSKTILKKITEINNAQNIVVIPSASSFPRDLGETYSSAFKSLGAKNVHVFDIRKKKETETKQYAEILETAELVFFTGGDQVQLVDRIYGTKLFEKIVHLYKTKGITIAGTSAGAAAASNPLLYDGDGIGLNKNSIKTYQGFDFVPGITIDTHFHARRRLARLTQCLLAGYSDYGIGLDEDTAIIISPNDCIEVVGSGLATLLRKKSSTQSNYNQLQANQSVSVDKLEIGLLHQGIRFDLKKWELITEKSTQNKKSAHANCN